MNETENITKIPIPSEGSEEALARSIIEMVLNFSLNRHVHELDDNGYLKSSKYYKDGGWKDGKPNKALQLKFDLMDEAVELYQPQIVEKLRERS